MTTALRMSLMQIWSAEGLRSVDGDSIVACYADAPVGGFCNISVCLFDGREVSGRAHADAGLCIAR
jgi:hypothetical protein